MEDQSDALEKATKLRWRAEEAARQEDLEPLEDPETLSSSESLRALHQLRVHQIELQMQNDELRRVQAELGEAWARYVDLFESAPVGYFIVSPGGLILEANRTSLTMLGLKETTAVGQPITRHLFSEDQDIYYLHRKRLLENDEPAACELRMVRQDGTPFWVRLLATSAQIPADDQGPATDEAPVCRIVFSDITELKEAEGQKVLLEAQLRQAEKREALGVLTGGFAHDINNLIAIIVGNANLGNIAVEPNSKVAHYFENIEKASVRISNLTRQMLAYAGRVEIEMAEMDPDIVVKEFIQLFSVSVPRNTTLRCELADRLPFTMGDSTQIFHVLMSLVTNAFEAIPEDIEGEVLLRTHAESVDERTLASGHWPLPVPPGYYATIEVTDTGVGMATEILALSCDPFFSTKFTGRGLGLAAVIGILGGHGGGLRVQSEPGQGSSFKIYLPAMPGARTAPLPESASTWRGEGRLLVVDDEQAVRSVARQMAERLGFSVVEAWSGLEAIEIFRLHHDEFTLVLLDLGMPRMTGREAFRVMRKIDGTVPMVLSSGYDVRESDMQIEGLAGFLKKPYRIAEFQGMLQRTLARSASR